MEIGLNHIHRVYGFSPLLCDEPRILILGTLPGGESLKQKQVRGLEVGVHPHYRRETVILDAVAGRRVIGDDFPAAAATPTGIESNRIMERPVFSQSLPILRLLSSANICKISSCLSVNFIGPFIGSG